MSETSPGSTTSADASVIQSSSSERWRRASRVTLLGALSAFGPLSIDMYLPSLPALSHDLSASASAAQLTLSACLLGLAFGQIVAGPLSDALGRRGPLLVGMAMYALSSFLCTIAPSVYLLVFLRLLQGIAGAAGIAIARAIVRDLYTGVAVARVFSLLVLISGIAPILAPLLGGFLLRFTSWRGVFIVLALVGAVLFLGVAFGLDETLPVSQRQRGGLRAIVTVFSALLGDRVFVGCALSLGLVGAALFAYISGSPFVVQDIYGLSPQVFSLIFGANSLGIAIASQINGRLAGRVSARHLLCAGLAIMAPAGLAVLLAVLTHSGLPGLLPALFVTIASLGIVFPSAITLGMNRSPSAAGSASALLGVLQFSGGVISAPLVGVAGTSTALPMALIIAVSAAGALLVFIVLVRGE
ncbi:MAG TPA: multidrug effflux MFS transporter [Ktedonobacteraceae bacterium]